MGVGKVLTFLQMKNLVRSYCKTGVEETWRQVVSAVTDKRRVERLSPSSQDDILKILGKEHKFHKMEELMIRHDFKAHSSLPLFLLQVYPHADSGLQAFSLLKNLWKHKLLDINYKGFDCYHNNGLDTDDKSAPQPEMKRIAIKDSTETQLMNMVNMAGKQAITVEGYFRDKSINILVDTGCDIVCVSSQLMPRNE